MFPSPMIGVSSAALHQCKLELWLGNEISGALLSAWEGKGMSAASQKERSSYVLKEVTGREYAFV